MLDAKVTQLASTLGELRSQGLNDFAIAGSWTAHLRNLGFAQPALPGDLDLVVGSLGALPDLRRSRLLARHYHPLALQGELVAQFVDPIGPTRIDLFLAGPAVLSRSRDRSVGDAAQPVVDAADYACALTRLCWPLTQGRSVPCKYLDALERCDAIDPRDIWREYRPADAPLEYREARSVILDRARRTPHLLVEMTYSRDVDRQCARCRIHRNLPLAAPIRIRQILGYV